MLRGTPPAIDVFDAVTSAATRGDHGTCGGRRVLARLLLRCQLEARYPGISSYHGIIESQLQRHPHENNYHYIKV